MARAVTRVDTTAFATSDEQEVVGYAEVMDRVFSSWQELALTENHIKQMHRDMLIHGTKDARHRGSYKTLPNSVVAFDENGDEIGVVFETATPFDPPRLMSELTEWHTEALRTGSLHPLLVIGIWVVVFLEIHPFQDGNGRLSRILTTLQLLRNGYAYVPYTSLESVIEQNEDSYYTSLRGTQRTIRTGTPDWQPWLSFFLDALAAHVDRLERKIEREHLVLATLPELSLQIVELAREHGRITMADAIRLTGSNRNTLKQHFRSLVRAGHLTPHGAGRGAWYQIR